jgi:hypothetical protein
MRSFAVTLMKSRTADDVCDSLFQAAEEGRLFDGQLLQRPNSAKHLADVQWRVSSCVPDATFELFRRTREKCVMTSDVLGLSEARAYWVLAYQSGWVQHRFVLPLAGAEVVEMCQSASRNGLRLEMRTAGSEATFIVKVPVSPPVQAALVQRCAQTFNADAVLQEMLVVSADLLIPGTLRPAPGKVSPTSVSVTGVLPGSLQALSSK